jgi:hypothetical protein
MTQTPTRVPPDTPVQASRLVYVTFDLDAAGRPSGAQFRGVGVGRHVRFTADATARCHCRTDTHRRAPAAEGTCGFYLPADPQQTLRWWSRFAADGACLADVEGFGHVVEHGVEAAVEGWRTERIRVLGLQVPQMCMVCERRGPVTAAAEPTGVGHQGGWQEADLLTLCPGCRAGAGHLAALELCEMASLLGVEVSAAAVP